MRMREKRSNFGVTKLPSELDYICTTYILFETSLLPDIELSPPNCAS